MAGAAETVERMTEHGPVALASSTPTRLISLVLAPPRHGGLVLGVCSAEDERYGKPHPAVFPSAAAALGVPG